MLGVETVNTHNARLNVVCCFCFLTAYAAITCSLCVCMQVTGEHEKITCK